MGYPWWHQRQHELDRYMHMLRRERIRRELEEPKKWTDEEVQAKLRELRTLLDSFVGQKVPPNFIPFMQELHKELKHENIEPIEPKKKPTLSGRLRGKLDYFLGR